MYFMVGEEILQHLTERYWIQLSDHKFEDFNYCYLYDYFNYCYYNGYFNYAAEFSFL